jgi:hypothetical protein
VCAYSLDHITPISLASYSPRANASPLQPLCASAAYTFQHAKLLKNSLPPSLGPRSRPPRDRDLFSLILVEPGGFEPPTPCLQSRCSPG